MPTYDPEKRPLTPTQVAAIRTRKIALLKAEGLIPTTPPKLLDEMVSMLDPEKLHETLAAVKSKWEPYFGKQRSADRIAAQALRK